MKVAVINTVKNEGGAAKIAGMLSTAYNQIGSVSSKMYHMGDRESDSNFRGLQIPAARQLNAAFFRVTGVDTPVPLDISSKIIDRAKDSDVIHLHNLHGYYLDYKNLLALWGDKPIIWTWHDAWGATGRCAYPRECDGWKTGCQSCANMNYYPASLRDRASKNYIERFNVLANNRHLQIVSPSEWLAEIAIERGYPESRVTVIPNPVDVEQFSLTNPTASRQVLDLPFGKKIILFVAAQCDDPRKGYLDFCHATEGLDTLNIAIGSNPPKLFDHVKCVGAIESTETMSHYFSVANVVVVPSYADNYPNVILESIASGVPVIGYNSGGVSELLRFPFSKGVAAGDIQHLNLALKEWLIDKHDLDHVKKTLRQAAMDNWAIRNVAANYVRLMQKML